MLWSNALGRGAGRKGGQSTFIILTPKWTNMSRKYNSLSPREIVLLPLLAISSSQTSVDQSKTATYPILKIYNCMGTLNQLPGSEIKAAGDKGIDKWQWSFDQLLLATEGKIQQQKRLAKKKKRDSNKTDDAQKAARLSLPDKIFFWLYPSCSFADGYFALAWYDGYMNLCKSIMKKQELQKYYD